MKNLILTIFLIGCFKSSFSQIKVDSLFIYYGMTQLAPVEPLMDYIENLETSGAKIQKLKTDELDKIKSSFSKTKLKKYKAEKHKGTVYFFVIYTGGKKQFGAIDSSLEEGKFVNLSDKQIWKIEDKAAIDKLYYDLLQIH